MAFEGKVILLTGAASGIGAATALQFAKLSAQLALVDKNEENLTEILTDCEKESNTKHLTIVADLSNQEELLTIVPKTVQRFGRIDVLINCAGIVSVERMTDKDVTPNFDRIIGVNLKAPVVLTNKAAPYLIKTKGNIVNISSIHSRCPSDKVHMYCVSKAGLEMFTKCVAIDLADRGVRANSVHPGYVRTNIYGSTIPSANPDEHYDRLNQALPFGVMEPREVAKLIAFLANSEDARSITGGSYFIDGGAQHMNIQTLCGKY